MIILTLKSVVKDQHADDFVNFFSEVSENLVKENSCLEYQLNRDYSSNNTFYIIGKWTNKKALDNHLTTEKMRAYFSNSKQWCISKNMTIYKANLL